MHTKAKSMCEQIGKGILHTRKLLTRIRIRMGDKMSYNDLYITLLNVDQENERPPTK